MQFLIDTATDSPTELYKIGRFLCDQFECMPVVSPEAGRDSLGHEFGQKDAPPPPPAAPHTMPGYVPADMDPEIETDDENSVKSVTVLATAAPPPPPAAPAPPGPAAAPEYDAKGAPWDGRIHASNRAKKIDGTWKNKRGVSADLITACEAQNKPGNATTTATPATASAVVPVTTVAPAPPAVPPPPAAPLAATSSAAPSTGNVPIDFRGLMQKIQAATAANKLTAEQVNAALAGVGLKPEEMAQLINNAPLIASLNAAVDACLT